jgi:hypothetical protein
MTTYVDTYVRDYTFVKNIPIRSKLHISDNYVYATVYQNGVNISIALTKEKIDIVWFKSFKEEVSRLSNINRDEASILHNSFYNFNQNHNLLAIIEGVVNSEPANELLLTGGDDDTSIPILHIMWISSNPYYSGNRFGVLLMYLLVNYVTGIKYITLDDDTDILPINIEHTGKTDNIYYLIGFKHKGRKGQEEYWKTWNPSNSIEGPERIISVEDFIGSREIISISKMYSMI